MTRHPNTYSTVLVAALCCPVSVLGAQEPTASDAPPTRQGAASDEDDDEYELRLSLPTEQDHEAWQNPGLRLQLGYAYGRYSGYETAPSFSGHQILIRPQVRIDRWWSLAATASYAITRGSLSGLRWGVTLETLLHPIGGLGLALGLGYAGISANVPSRMTPRVPAVSRAARADEHLNRCDDGGWVALGRVEYLFVAGPLFASGPFAHVDIDWVACSQRFEETEPDTGRRRALHRWWRHRSYNVGWWFTWR